MNEVISKCLNFMYSKPVLCGFVPLQCCSYTLIASCLRSFTMPVQIQKDDITAVLNEDYMDLVVKHLNVKRWY